jgi:hypothetical protein
MVLRSDSTRIHTGYLVNEEPYFGCSLTTEPLRSPSKSSPRLPDETLLRVLESRSQPLDAPIVLSSLLFQLQRVQAAEFHLPMMEIPRMLSIQWFTATYVQCRNGGYSAVSALWIERSTRSVHGIVGARIPPLPRVHRWRACLRSLRDISLICVNGSWVIVNKDETTYRQLLLALCFESYITFPRVDIDQYVERRACCT